jgi:hypothetical protein
VALEDLVRRHRDELGACARVRIRATLKLEPVDVIVAVSPENVPYAAETGYSVKLGDLIKSDFGGVFALHSRISPGSPKALFKPIATPIRTSICSRSSSTR